MRQSRHKSVDTALTYIEAGDTWRNNITEPVFRGRERGNGPGPEDGGERSS